MVFVAVDDVEELEEFHRIRRLLGQLKSDPKLCGLFEDDEQAVIACHFDDKPALEARGERRRWRRAEFKNAYLWLSTKSEATFETLRQRGHRSRLCVLGWKRRIPRELASEARRLGIYVQVGARILE